MSKKAYYLLNFNNLLIIKVLIIQIIYVYTQDPCSAGQSVSCATATCTWRDTRVALSNYNVYPHIMYNPFNFISLMMMMMVVVVVVVMVQ